MNDTTQKPLHVSFARIHNVKGVRDITIRPEPGKALVVLGGPNAAGKTSTIDAIMWALTGKPSVQMPIRRGETEARVEVDLSEEFDLKLKAVRRWWVSSSGEIKSDLKLMTPDGAEYKKGQTILDGLISSVSVDPFALITAKPKDQVEAARKALKIDTSDLDQQKASAEDERRELKKQQEWIKANAAHLSEFEDEDLPESPLSRADLDAELRAATAANSEAEAKRFSADNAKSMLRSADEKIAQGAEEIAELERQLQARRDRHAAALEKRQQMAADAGALEAEASAARTIDTAPILERLNQVDEINRKIAERARKRESRAKWEELDVRRAEAQKTIEQCEADRRKRIEDSVKNAKFAIQGFDITEDGLFLKGIPLDQCNTAEQLKLAVAIALIENPRIRVFRVGDGEKLDPESLEILRGLAEEAGAQIFAEMALAPADVAAGFREVTELITDGHLAKIVWRHVDGRELTREEAAELPRSQWTFEVVEQGEQGSLEVAA